MILVRYQQISGKYRYGYWNGEGNLSSFSTKLYWADSPEEAALALQEKSVYVCGRKFSGQPRPVGSDLKIEICEDALSNEEIWE